MQPLENAGVDFFRSFVVGTVARCGDGFKVKAGGGGSVGGGSGRGSGRGSGSIRRSREVMSRKI